VSETPAAVETVPRKRSRGRPHGSKGPKTPGELALVALRRGGGAKFFRQLKEKHPKEFAALLPRFKEQGEGVSNGTSYLPVPIPVECRDAIPALLASAMAARAPASTAPPIPIEAKPAEPDDWM
jgi:hypothetical protein